MRRLASILMLCMTTTLLVIGLVAGPALATEADSSADQSGESTGFGTGDWDGLILAVIGGLIVGTLAFASSGPSHIGGSDDHH